ncbi:hypothetical protein VM1G_11830 [Cytospora mali]|uniref:Digeranylgeranylglyceryl phosphate synthase n=1 Tax=Cytospora mali TaxID=578113 RepID=A0A194W6C3_CYTMA|nr:hypothetical protein VM1G_11830 [Valsa mali]
MKVRGLFSACQSSSTYNIIQFSNEQNACEGQVTGLMPFISSYAHLAAYHIKTLWLFTFSDLKTIVIPSTIFGITNALAAPVYRIRPTLESSDMIWRVPVVFLWVWFNLIPFAINNQRTPLAIAEDSANKPWRPLPRGRLTPAHAKILMVCFYIAVPIVSVAVNGGLRQGICLVFLGTWYNNFGGADHHPVLRNTINALGYSCFTSGAMEVALAAPLPLSTTGPFSRWFAILAGIILTTVHTQDMYDQEGDAIRNRRTMPLVVGDV